MTSILRQLNLQRQELLQKTLPPIAVLDHGYVKVVDALGDDEFIVESARMSTTGSFRGWETDHSMLDHMYRNRHSSPFEFGYLVIEVQAPILVFRQWHRHRTLSVSEQSARYCSLPDLCYVPELDRLQEQSSVNKQASSGTPLSLESAARIRQQMRQDQIESHAHYEMYLESGLARELARNNLPVSQYSRMRAAGNLRNWLHFLGLRMDPHAQEEIRAYATEVGELISKIWPRTYNFFLEYDFHGLKLGKTEVDVLEELLASFPADTVNDVCQKYGLSKTRTRELIQKFSIA